MMFLFSGAYRLLTWKNNILVTEESEGIKANNTEENDKNMQFSS